MQLSNDGKQDTAIVLFRSIFGELLKAILSAAPMTIGGDHVKVALQNIAKYVWY